MTKTDLQVQQLNNTVAAIVQVFHGKDTKSIDPKKEVRGLVKDFAMEVLRAGRRQVGEYGQNTHSYACLDAFCVELNKDL